MIRPRFSLRWLLLLTAIIAAFCYWQFAMPTMTARRFAQTVEQGDYRAAASMNQPTCGLDLLITFGIFGPAGTETSIEKRRFVVALEPLTWNDIILRKRRIVLHVDDDSKVLNGAFGLSPGPIVLNLVADSNRVDYHSKSLAPNRPAF
jgi:hypothetical protein